MIEGKPSPGILLQNRKGGTVHRFINFQPFCNALGEHGFSHAKVSDQGKYLSRFTGLSDFYAQFICLFRAISFCHIYCHFFLLHIKRCFVLKEMSNYDIPVIINVMY